MPRIAGRVNLLFEVWRQTARHTDIGEAIEQIARLVAGELPADHLVVRHLDIERLRLETVAAASPRGAAALGLPTRSESEPGRFRQLLAWCRQGTTLRGRVGDGAPLLGAMVPAGARGDVIAGPLGDPERPSGLLLALAAGGARLTTAHETLMQSLLEPSAVALLNDARLHELSRLREALEADKRALLTRLDRQDVSDAIVGADAGLRAVLERVEQVAHTDAPVLILGETGTGKEVIARAIHARSRRAGGPVVRVNCGALPPGLMDSELFGHERGSFTGAVTARQGVFERGDGGTLFLDEIGELPPDAQVRLLRILQDGTFERVGGHRTLTVDVRVVAATHADLQDMVARKTFREDLWYRIAVFPIRLPPLRARPEDIPGLSAHFAWRAGNRLRGQPLFPSAEDIELLRAYPWPGNVRELAAVIERAAILGDGRRLEVRGALGASAQGWEPPSASRVAGWHAEPPAPASLAAAMAAHIERALESTGGRIEGPAGAAALLAINPHTLRARMRRLGVDWRRYRKGAAPGNGSPRAASRDNG